jgi:predicted TIM-barrel enzyme
VVLPVIHVESEEQALRNAEIARSAGADGLFLINHTGPCDELLAIHRRVRREIPDGWVGVNCLDLDPEDVFARVSDDVAGVWADDACIDERRSDQPEAEAIARARRESGWGGLYFGGVAFKYRRPVQELARAAAIATGYMDVVTTSGPGTGLAAERAKIVAMKEAVGDLPLAIASGITPENVADYLVCADCFLVATGISRSFTELEPSKVRRLVERVREYG